MGPCDADPAVADNTVKVWVVGVYSAPVTTLGTFSSGAAGGVVGSALEFQNPSTAGALTQTIRCQQNSDVHVQFDVALMRPANQGFFDIAVNFNDIFCAAKFDCCTEDAGGTTCASDIRLLFESGATRGPTMVLGLACTAGPTAGVETHLYLDAIALDCSSPSAGSFAPDFTISPSGPVGNQCTAGAVGGGACAAVSSPGALDADTYLYQVGVYRGQEELQTGGVAAQKAYWNVALGVRRSVAAGPGIEDCWLRTRATADDALGTSFVDAGTIAAGAVYPFVQWDVDLASCKAEPLTFGDPAAMVRAEYTKTSDGGTSFAYQFGPTSYAPSALGDGADGALTVSGTQVINTATQLTADATSGATSLTVGSATGFAAGDEVLVIQMQADGATAQAGTFELARLVGAGAGVLTLQGGLSYGYASGTFDTAAATATQVVRVPNYTSVTVPAGTTLRAPAWDGFSGGVLALRSQGAVVVDGTIDAAATGFRGGRTANQLGIAWDTDGMEDGESWTGRGVTATPGTANAGGGDGASYHNEPPGGGGGSYGTQGGVGTVDPNWPGPATAGPSATYGQAQLDAGALFAGSGGGSGMLWSATYGSESPGGAGGGIVYITANTITVTGSITVRGGQAADSGHDYSSAGGSGSGGSIYLAAPSVNVGSGAVDARGGDAQVLNAGGGSGGEGGDGRIEIATGSLTGTTLPAPGYTTTFVP